LNLLVGRQATDNKYKTKSQLASRHLEPLLIMSLAAGRKKR